MKTKKFGSALLAALLVLFITVVLLNSQAFVETDTNITTGENNYSTLTETLEVDIFE